MKVNTRPRSDLPTVILHWGVVMTLLLSLATGLRIAADMPGANWAQSVADVLPQGNVIAWHLWGAMALLGFSAAYVGFLWKAGLLTRIALNRAWWRMLRSPPEGQTRWKAVNILVYWLAFAALVMAGLTGLLLDLAPGVVPFALLATVHQALAWSIPAYIVVHVVALVFMGGVGHLLKILRPQRAFGPAAVVGLVAGSAVAAAFYAVERTSGDTLAVARVATIPDLDGKASDPIWQDANEVVIPTMRGENLPGGEVDVTVRAMHDGEFFYGLFQWPDSTRSFKHLPLVKHEDGWRVQQTEFGIQDEDSYYEDKFGVMLTRGNGPAGDGSVHLGTRPLAGKPASTGGRGLHYTTDGGIVDVWHWKSVRSGNPLMNQIDDNYFGPPMEPTESGRYTGGYTQDPKTGGGFVMNWEAYSDGVVTPRNLPRDPAMLDAFQDVDLSPTASDEQMLYLRLEDTVPYDPALDTYPEGTIMPAVLVDAPYEGDRGDVTAISDWQDGVWTMEVKRRLDTGSEFDVAFTDDAPVYLWVAVFDHAQTRHSQHLHPVTVAME